MSLNLPSQRLVRSALTLPHRPLPCLRLHPQHRTIFGLFERSRRNDPPPTDPIAADFLKRKPVPNTVPQAPKPGDLAPSSIFEQESDDASPTGGRTDKSIPLARRRNPTQMAAALDPNPESRKRWERRMIIRSMRKRFRINKTTLLARTERTSTSKSHMLLTSVKKLGMLARQIAGKPVEDAIVQMRFSKKKVAKLVLNHLEYARDEATVKRGMGLGGVKFGGEAEEKKQVRQGEELQGEKKRGEKKLEEKVEEPVVVVGRDGKRRTVRDRTAMYVDEAWVGRGTYGRKPDYRARGQLYMMRPPTTSITVVLKEEATRVRLMKEKEEKRLKKKPWVHLPDRPITAQRQYALW